MIALATMLLAFVPPAWPLSATDVSSLEKGAILSRDFETEGMKGATIRFFVAAPRRRCYDVLADVYSLPLYMPGMKSIKVVSDQGLVKVLEYETQQPMMPGFTIARHHEPDRRIWWTKVKASVRRIEGAWDFHSVAGGTVLDYTLAIDTGQLLVPNWLAVAMQKQGTQHVAHNVRKRIESGGKWVRPDAPVNLP